MTKSQLSVKMTPMTTTCIVHQHSIIFDDRYMYIKVYMVENFIFIYQYMWVYPVSNCILYCALWHSFECKRQSAEGLHKCLKKNKILSSNRLSQHDTRMCNEKKKLHSSRKFKDCKDSENSSELELHAKIVIRVIYKQRKRILMVHTCTYMIFMSIFITF